MNRIEFANCGVNKDDRILEFGPFCYPLFKKRDGFNVDIVDRLSKEELYQIVSENAPKEDIEDVDYICSSDYYRSIRKEYDIIVASNFIEHTVDIVGFLQDLSKLLTDRGVIKLIIPDKRFMFDYFRENTSIREVINNHVYRKGYLNHSVGAVIDYNMSASSWLDDSYILNSAACYPDEINLTWGNRDFTELLVNHNDNDNQNIHSWVFTPRSFEIIMYQLNMLGLIDLMIDKLYENESSMQFFVELVKGVQKPDENKLKELFIKRKIEEMSAFSDYITLLKYKEFDNVYIYGTGFSAIKISYLMEKMGIGLKGYIVSDDYYMLDEINGKSVHKLSEMRGDIHILVCVTNTHSRNEISNQLKALGYEFENMYAAYHL